MPKAKRNPAFVLLRATAILPPIGFAAYFLALHFLDVPAAIADLSCMVCRALTIYGLVVIFVALLVASLALLFLAIAAFTSWLDRYGLLEDIIVYFLLVALIPLSLIAANLLFAFPANWWRSWTAAAICNGC